MKIERILGGLFSLGMRWPFPLLWRNRRLHPRPKPLARK
jgi:hypothetical protein